MIPYTDIWWPEQLPCVHRDGYNIQPEDTFQTTSLASGRTISRRLFSFVPSEVRVQMVMTNEQAAVFEPFFRDVLNDGVKWFNLDLKTPRAGMEPLVVKFKEMYQGPRLHQNGDRWVFNATLLTFERPIWPAPWGDAPDWIYNASRFDVLMNWVWPEYHFDFETYDDAWAAFDTLRDGQVITVRDVDGVHAKYRVRRNTGPSLSLNFADQIYFVTDGPNALILVKTWQ